MRVLLIHQSFMTEDEAGSTRHFELARYLVKKGHEVTIIGSAVSYLTGRVEDRFRGKFLFKEVIDGVKVIRCWTYSKINKSYAKRFLSFISFMISSIIGGLNAGKMDVVIACSPQIFTGISGYILSKIRRVPFIFEIRDLWPKFAIETKVLTSPVLIFLAKFLEKSIYKRADYFIINSPGFYGHLGEFGIPEEKIFLIPNGVDTSIFKPGEKYDSVRKEMGLNKNFVVMYAGAHGRANGLDTVIESARILNDYSDIIFMLVGDGKEKERLIRLKDSYGLRNVLFADAQPKSRMPLFCAAADVCLAILENRNSFNTVYPNKVFDYMASGRPTLLAIDGVIRDVVEKARAGVFVEQENSKALAETVLSLSRNRKLLEEYGANARKYVMENFERKDIAEKLNETLKKIVGGSNEYESDVSGRGKAQFHEDCSHY